MERGFETTLHNAIYIKSIISRCAAFSRVCQQNCNRLPSTTKFANTCRATAGGKWGYCELRTGEIKQFPVRSFLNLFSRRAASTIMTQNLIWHLFRPPTATTKTNSSLMNRTARKHHRTASLPVSVPCDLQLLRKTC